jgi:hypothetical protein
VADVFKELTQLTILNHLQLSLKQVDRLLSAAIARAEASGFDASDALRGLVVRPEEAHAIMEQSPLDSLWLNNHKHTQEPISSLFTNSNLPFVRLMEAFGLTEVDTYILLLALAPELDRRYERIYGYLQDDVTLRYPTVNLTMHLLGGDISQRFSVWERLQSHMPLLKYHLINIDKPDHRPNSAFINHILKLDSRIVSYVLGQSIIDTRLEHILMPAQGLANIHLSQETLLPIYENMQQAPLIFMLGTAPLEQAETALALCEEHSLPLLHLRCEALKELELPPLMAWRLALREGHLQGAALFITGWDSLLDEDGELPAPLWTGLLDFPKPVFICAREKWESLDTQRERLLLRLHFDTPDYDSRLQAWQYAIGADDIDHVPIRELATKYRFHRAQITRTVHTARDFAASRGATLQITDLQNAAQAHARLKLGRFARHVEDQTPWDQLILPEEPLTQLHEIVDRVRFAHVVQDNWGFKQHLSNSSGISALFAGESGTGKTLSAQTLAGDLALPLYKIDLSGVVSKYIGETEKNLRVIFEEAQSSSAILFFDEADALFGKRSEVKDARDRYANIEVAYLLQQIEEYDGIAILATNLRQNLDEAFTRRLDFMIDFPFPEPIYRRRIWEVHFPPQAPLDPEIDLDDLAQRYELSGGNIRNVALAAAYLAAVEGSIISLSHIRMAIRREHQKMGRLLHEDN